ncbi:pentatricopeptide repeat-containing protein At3g12770-like [Nymphaea colorata]|nr:pentatricopeptide repeat-containing protein At3g12770-like [Nymphaea colorata]
MCLRRLRQVSGACAPIPAASFRSVASVLDLCTSIHDLHQIHARFVVYGLQQNTFVASKLVAKYAELGDHGRSERIFELVENPNLILWNAVIKACSTFQLFDGAFLHYRNMVLNSVNPDEFTFHCVFKACSHLSALTFGRQCHSHAFRLGLHSDAFVGTSLIGMYCKCGEIGDARRVFDEIPVRNLFLWNALINGVSHNDDAVATFELLKRMQREGIRPDSASMVSILLSCSKLGCLRAGKMVHLLAVLDGLEKDLSVGTSLVTMYAKMNDLQMATKVFDRIPQKDVVLWNAMLSGYNQNGEPEKALMLLVQMQTDGVRDDYVTITGVISAAAKLKSLEAGKQIHAHAIRSSASSEVLVHNSLIEMYFKCGKLNSACNIFYRITNRTVISWSSMIAAYVFHGQFVQALSLFKEMKQDGVGIDSISIINVLPACIHISALPLIEGLHGYAIKHGFGYVIPLVTALLVAYGKCGSIEAAQQLFDESAYLEDDLILWNSMINLYALYGNWDSCFSLLKKMNAMGLKPDHYTFLGLLMSCNHAGLVEEGWGCFESMMNVHNCQPSQEHYACMVDLLGRSGHIGAAKKIIQMMPFQPDSRVWGALLSACKTILEPSIAEFAAAQLLSREPFNAGNYILLSNVYAAAEMWDGVQRLRGMIKDKGLKKRAGYSWIGMHGQVYAFHAGDTSHPRSEDIYYMLRKLDFHIKDRSICLIN